MLVQPPMAPCDCCLLNRVKSFTFKEQEVTVEIPKPLLLADIIVRLQTTKNDVYTPLSHTGKSASRPPSKTTVEPEGRGRGRGGRSWLLLQRMRRLCVCVLCCVCVVCVCVCVCARARACVCMSVMCV